MSISYGPLWKKLEENNITRTELRESVKLASSTYSKLIKNESVTTDTILCLWNSKIERYYRK